jgi:arabinofuranan 3-O-arabinosyltransferase
MPTTDRTVQRPVRTRPAAWWLGIWAILAIAVCVWRGPMYAQVLLPGPDQAGCGYLDFFQEWASARNLLEGRPVYTPHRDSYRRFLPDAPPPAPDDRYFIEVNAHPPTSVLLALPLAWLSFPEAMRIWNLLSLAALALSGLIITRQLNMRLAAWWLLPLTVLVLLNVPLQEQVRQGQLNLVLLLLLTGCWAADRSGRPVLAGLLLATASTIKLFPAFVFLYYIFRKEWRVVASGAACAVFLTLATALILGPESYVSYVRDAIAQANEWRSGWDNASLPGLFAKLFDPGTKHDLVRPLVHSVWAARACSGLSAFVVIALLAWKVRPARSLRDRDLGFAAAVMAMLILAPMTWPHAFLVAALPAAILWTRSTDFSYQRRALLVLILLLSLPVSFYYQFTLETGQLATEATARPTQTLTLLSIHLYSLMALFGLGLAGMGKKGQLAGDREINAMSDAPPKAANSASVVSRAGAS